MSSSSHALGLLVHWYRELLSKEAGRRWVERTAGRAMRAPAARPCFEPVEPRMMMSAALLASVNQASTSTDHVITYQPSASAPPSVTINQAADQADNAAYGTGIKYTVVFSSPVVDFGGHMVRLSGTAVTGSTSVAYPIVNWGDDQTYTITVTGMSGSGTVIASIDAGQAHDAFGQGNEASTSTDNVVLFDAPVATVTPTAGQADPSEEAAAYFTISFNDFVTGFGANTPLTIGGTAPGIKSWTWLNVSGTTYTIKVTGMTGSGTVTVSLPAGAVQDYNGTGNAASANADNVVNYQGLYATPFTTTGAVYSVIAVGDELWFTEPSADLIGRRSADGTITEYSVTPGTKPGDLCVGSDGSIWFTSFNDGTSNKIGRVQMTSIIVGSPPAVVISYSDSGVHNYTRDITAGPDGNLWYRAAGGALWKMTTAGVATYTVATGSSPTSGPDDSLWYFDAGGIGKRTIDGTTTHFAFPAGNTYGWLLDLTAGSDGNLWFTASANGQNGKIVRMTPAGVFTEFSTGFPGDEGSPRTIIAGSDGNLWYTNPGRGIGRITPAGVISEYAIPGAPNSLAGAQIAMDNQQNPWVVYDWGVHRIAKMSAAAPVPAPLPLSVTIDQAAAQTDPASDSPIVFSLSFSRPVLWATFISKGLQFSGTATGTPVATITDSGDHTNFSVSVTGVTGSGTLIATVLPGAVQDADGVFCEASTSTDNEVAFNTAYVVSTTADSGLGSLRDAIEWANAHPGTDLITFNLPGSGVQMIAAASELPAITEALVIDGRTQAGYAGFAGVAAAPVVFIDGRATPIASGDSVLAGLDAQAMLTLRAIGIAGFSNNIWLGAGSDGSLIQGCYVGLDPAGTQDWQIHGANSTGLNVQSGNNQIGGTTADARNVIAGSGIALAVGPQYLWHDDTQTNEQITTADYNVIEGNYIGTDATGTAAIGTGEFSDGGSTVGQLVLAEASHTRIGGSEPGAGNVVASDSIAMNISGSFNLIEGNNVHVAPDGVTGIFATAGGASDGIYFNWQNTHDNVARNNVIGPVQGNGIAFAYGAHDNLAEGNFIGVDRSGAVDLGHPTESYSGIYFVNADHNTARGNVIGNWRRGMRFGYPGLWHATDNVAVGNYIGVTPAWRNVGNREVGILVGWGDDNIIGGVNPGDGNIIANNGWNPPAGQRVGGVIVSLGQRNSIRGNTFLSNQGLPIDLGMAGAMANDTLDADTGANERQNYPVIDAVQWDGATVGIVGHIHSTPSTTFTLDFYNDSVGTPEIERTYLLSFDVTTDAGGDAVFDQAVACAEVPALDVTATDPQGNTSEFAGMGLPYEQAPVVTVADITVNEDAGQTAFALVLDRVSDQDVSVLVATEDATALYGEDYQALTPTWITILAGNLSAEVVVTVLEDVLPEPDESFGLRLLDVNGGTLGAAAATATIQDNDVVVDVGGTMATATHLMSGYFQSLIGDDGTDADVDVFKFYAPAGATITVDLTSSEIDTYLRMFDVSGASFTADDDGGDGSNSRIENFTIESAGVYYIGVSSFSNTAYSIVDGSDVASAGVGMYELSITGMPVQDPGSLMPGAWPLELDVEAVNGIDPADDTDLFKITIADGEGLSRTFTITEIGAFEPCLRLFDSDGNVLADSTGTFHYTFAGPGTYYLGITGAPNDHYDITTGSDAVAGSVGDYGIRMTQTLAPFQLNDPGLEAAIRQQLIDDGFTPGATLTPVDMLNLTSLYASNQDISDLSGLEYARNLQSLIIDGNQIADVSPLLGLTQLSYLDISSNPIGNAGLSAIAANMAGLTNLAVGNAGITALPSFTAVPSLTYLTLDNNVLAGATLDIPQLTVLIADNTGIQPSGVTSLTNLYYLSLAYNDITDASDLAGLTNLQYVYMSGNQSLQLMTLAGLTQLTAFGIAMCGLDDADMASLNWEDFGSLTFLAADDNPITNLSFVPRIASVDRLDVLLAYRCPGLADISGLASATGLSDLYLYGGAIRDISPLTPLTNLRTVYLADNRIATLTKVDWSAMANLNTLYVHNNRLDISPGSPSRDRIDAMQAGGVSVSFDPQSVVNTAPEVSIDAHASTSEGATWSATGSFTDPDADAWTATVDYGDAAGAQVLALNADKTFTLSHRYDHAGDYTVTVSVDDGGDTPGSATSSVQVAPPLQVIGDQAQAGQSDQIRLARNAADPSLLDIFLNSATPTSSVNFASLGRIVINGLAGDDTLTLDLANGPVIPAGGISYDGGAHTLGDSLIIAGSSGDDAVSFAADQATIGAGVVTLAGVESRSFSGGAGTDSLTLGAGSYAFTNDLGAGTDHLNLVLADGAQVAFSGVQHLGGLALSGGSKVTLADGGGNTLVVHSLSVDATSSLDIADNALIVDYTGNNPFAGIYSQVASSAGNHWAGSGIVSHTAAAGGSEYAIGLVENGVAHLATFAGQDVDDTSVLIRFTYSGDANLDGKVDLTDLSILAGSWQMPGRPWGQGDSDYSGSVDLTDLSLLASNWQKVLPAPVAAEVVSPASEAAPASQTDAAPAAGGAAVADPAPAEPVPANPSLAEPASTDPIPADPVPSEPTPAPTTQEALTVSTAAGAAAETAVAPSAEPTVVPEAAAVAPVAIARVWRSPAPAVGVTIDPVPASPVTAVQRSASLFSNRPLSMPTALAPWPLTSRGNRTLLSTDGVDDSGDILIRDGGRM